MNEAKSSTKVNVAEKNNNKSRVKTTDGVDLFPPEGSKMRKASQSWSYGGLMKDSKGRLITDTMYCALCPKSFKYNQSPSPLTDHLKYHHSDKMLELENSQKQIGGKKYSTGSIVLPFLAKFLRFLDQLRCESRERVKTQIRPRLAPGTHTEHHQAASGSETRQILETGDTLVTKTVQTPNHTHCSVKLNK